MTTKHFQSTTVYGAPIQVLFDRDGKTFKLSVKKLSNAMPVVSSTAWQTSGAQTRMKAMNNNHLFVLFLGISSDLFSPRNSFVCPKSFLSTYCNKVYLESQSSLHAWWSRNTPHTHRILLIHSAFILINSIQKIILRKRLRGYFTKKNESVNKKLLCHRGTAWRRSVTKKNISAPPQ